MRHAAILAGGGGTRLWPASRRSKPKQFLALGPRAGETLLGATVRRTLPVVDPTRVWVVTAADQAHAVREAAPGIPAAHVLAEPAARNTAAAIGLAAVHLLAEDPEAVVAVLPADHAVRDDAGFARALGQAFALAEERDAIVTVGIIPTRAETGFGWLELGAAADGAGARAVDRFVEKPAREAAERMLAERKHWWNAGIFVFRARRILDEIARHLPLLGEALRAIAAAPAAERGAETERRYPPLTSISIDHGVMEKTRGILTVPGDFGWSDVGAWSALAETTPADAAANVMRGDPAPIAVDAERNVVVAEPGTVVALVGVHDLVVVQAGNAVLVLPRARAQDVREIVRELEARGLHAYL